jgi:Reverse transcriptase (RNA-dependent DNA polymerase)
MAYLQSFSPLSRTVYIRSSRSTTFVREQLHRHVLRVSKPLYGLVDSSSYWFNAYSQAFHGIRIKPTVLNECLIYRTGSASQNLDGLAGIQVDDTVMSGTMAFRTDETAMHSQFDLSSSDEGAVLSYSGVQILQCLGHTEASITQTPYIYKLLADLNIQNFADIQSVRAKLAWLANVSRSDITVHVAALAHITAKHRG